MIIEDIKGLADIEVEEVISRRKSSIGKAVGNTRHYCSSSLYPTPRTATRRGVPPLTFLNFRLSQHTCTSRVLVSPT